MIRQSFEVWPQPVKTDRSEDELIPCFRQGQCCAAGREATLELRPGGQESSRTAAAQDELMNNELGDTVDECEARNAEEDED